MYEKNSETLAFQRGVEADRKRCADLAREAFLKHEKVRKDATWGGQTFADMQLTFHEIVEWEIRDLHRAIVQGDQPKEMTKDEPDDDRAEDHEPEDE